MKLENYIINIPDYPIKGVQFKDISLVLKDKKAFKFSIESFANKLKDLDFDYIVGPEARGFIFGSALALHLNKGFIPIRKPGKLPRKTKSIEYELEYGKNKLEVHEDAVTKGQKVIIIDDILATGGTVEASAKLMESLGAEVVAILFLVELSYINGRKKLNEYNIHSLLKY